MECAICGFHYTSSPEDLKAHQKEHMKTAASYDRTIRQYKGRSLPLTWPGRPENEDMGTYSALNALNPRMIGFESITGLDHSNVTAFQNNDGEVIPYVVGGDGHDRAGLWLTSDGRVFEYGANWRAGVVHFSKHLPKQRHKTGVIRFE